MKFYNTFCNYILLFVDIVIFVYLGTYDDYKNRVYNFAMKANNAS